MTEPNFVESRGLKVAKGFLTRHKKGPNGDTIVHLNLTLIGAILGLLLLAFVLVGKATDFGQRLWEMQLRTSPTIQAMQKFDTDVQKDTAVIDETLKSIDKRLANIELKVEKIK